MVYVALEAAEELAKEGIELEIVDLRTLLPLDRHAIADVVRRTNKIIVLHEHPRTGGIAGEIEAIINEEAFDELGWPNCPSGCTRHTRPVLAAVGGIFPAQS